jgi:hypothetical protein
MRTALLLACTLAGGCALYTGPSNGDDQGDDALPLPDAGFVADASTDCAFPDTGEISVCGNLYDVETGEAVDSTTVSIKFYDALAYANSGSGAAELVPRSFEAAASWFKAERMPSTSSGFVAIVVDNVDGDPDDRAPTVMVTPGYSAVAINGMRAYSLRRFTNGTWTSALGLTDSALAHHPSLYLYRTDTGPVAGVSVTWSGNPVPMYSFDDMNPEAHHDPVAGNVTGADGSLLVLWPSNGNGGTLTSSGGISECTWNEPAVTTSPSDLLYVLDVGFTCPI